MRTQSIDTHPQAERVLIDLIRHASVAKRFKLVRSLTKTGMNLNLRNLQSLHPEMTQAEIAQSFVSQSLQPDLQAQAASLLLDLRQRPEWQVQECDILAALQPIAETLERLATPYYISGSLASSVYGMQQLARDIDLVIDISVDRVPDFLSHIHETYHADKSIIYGALHGHTNARIVHRSTLVCIDLIFPRSDSFEKQIWRHIHWHTLEQSLPPLPFSSAEDIVLTKLYHHCRTETIPPDDQWNDILGVLKVQGSQLDIPYLERWAAELGVAHQLNSACIDAGL